MTDKKKWEEAAEIVRDAGGTLVGRTRLQKVAYLLELTGQGAGFDFEYRQFGPYSEDLAEAVDVAQAFHLLTEKEEIATWGGRYSVFTCAQPQGATPTERAVFLQKAAAINAVELELAATAAYLKCVEGHERPWEETKRRKTLKATDERLEKAQQAYRELCEIKTPNPLPSL